MKSSFIHSVLVSLSFGFVSNVVFAQENLSDSLSAQDVSCVISSTTSPAFAIASSAYQGAYNNYGIPGFASFCQGIHWGRISSEMLITAAAKAGFVAISCAKDESLISDVAWQARSTCN